MSVLTGSLGSLTSVNFFSVPKKPERAKEPEKARKPKRVWRLGFDSLFSSG
jgi:hypothetical protein